MMAAADGKDERLSEIVGYSAFWLAYNTFEFYKDACYIAETPDSLGNFKKDPDHPPEEKYETVVVSVSDIIEDFSFSDLWYAFEPAALEKFKQIIDSIGIECRITTDNSESGSEENISRVHIQALDYGPDPSGMLQDLLEDLAVADGQYKRESVDAAIEKKDEIAPLLIEILEDILATPEKYAIAKNFMLLTYAAMLLGHFKETKAHSPIIKLLALPEDTVDALFGELVHENIPTILFRTSGGSFDEIKALVLNKSAWEYSRMSALRAMVLAVLDGALDRDVTLEFFSSLYRDKKDDFPEEFWTSFVRCVYDLYPLELMDTVKELYAEDLIELFFVRLEDLESALEQDKETFLEERRIEKQRHSLDDVHNAMSWWACFKKDKDTRTPRISHSPLDNFQKPKSKGKSKKIKSKKRIKKASRKKNRR